MFPVKKTSIRNDSKYRILTLIGENTNLLIEHIYPDKIQDKLNTQIRKSVHHRKLADKIHIGNRKKFIFRKKIFEYEK